MQQSSAFGFIFDDTDTFKYLNGSENITDQVSACPKLHTNSKQAFPAHKTDKIKYTKNRQHDN